MGCRYLYVPDSKSCLPNEVMTFPLNNEISSGALGLSSVIGPHVRNAGREACELLLGQKKGKSRL